MHPLAAVMQDDFRAAGAGAGDAGKGDDRAGTLARLRGAVRAIEGGGVGRRAMPLGVPAIDVALGGEGLPLACLHAVEGAAADGFAAAVAGRLVGAAAGQDVGDATGIIVWCVAAGARARLYPPGLAGLGLDPGRLIVVLCHRRAELLAVMEDALRSGAAALVVAELAGDPDPLTSRRLQLVCETGGVTGVLLLTEGGHESRRGGASVTAFHTRWRIEPAPSHPTGEEAGVGKGAAGEHIIATRWRLSLVRNRGGATGCWDVDFDGTTHRFALAAEADDR